MQTMIKTSESSIMKALYADFFIILYKNYIAITVIDTVIAI